MDSSVPSLRRVTKLHFVGIGGTGMSGIAEVMYSLGYEVSGSDLTKSLVTERLAQLGIKLSYSHIADNVAECDAIVVSNAIAMNNVELETARKRRIPIVPRAEMLAELMRFKHGIAVAGTHGKTTVTSLIATIFANAKLDPTFVVGGQLSSFGYNARLGRGDYFIAEADESDASFLHLTPMISVITNIDEDHLDNYENNPDKLQRSFLEFMHQVPFYGLLVLCIDCPNVRAMLPKISRPYLSYGFSTDADIRATQWQADGEITSFAIQTRQLSQPVEFKLKLCGKHNVLNALAAIAVAMDANIELSVIQESLEKFKGVGRRFELLGEYSLAGKNFSLVDDYGHHPREVAAVIEAMRGRWPGRRLVMIYQPHRPSRTKALFEDFVKVLAQTDQLLLLDIYTAGEPAITGVDSKTLCGSIRKLANIDPVYVDNTAELLPTLAKVLKAGDVVITQGAGDISRIVSTMVAELEGVTA